MFVCDCKRTGNFAQVRNRTRRQGRQRGDNAGIVEPLVAGDAFFTERKRQYFERNGSAGQFLRRQYHTVEDVTAATQFAFECVAGRAQAVESVEITGKRRDGRGSCVGIKRVVANDVVAINCNEERRWFLGGGGGAEHQQRSGDKCADCLVDHHQRARIH